ncbi:MAG: Fic family protein [Methanomicrobiaceae archaeon]|nr:Fic family protein [Methanomicrobiaceae archaeon]
MKIPEKAPGLWTQADDDKKEFSKILNILNNREPGHEEIQDIIKKYNDSEYIHWDDFKRKKNIPYDLKALWYVLKTYRSTANEIPLKIGDEYFRYTLLKKFQQGLHYLDINSPGDLDFINEMPDERAKTQYLRESLEQEAIYSSQLEGAATTRAVATKLLRENKKPKNRSEQMIVNNYHTIKDLKDIKNEPLTPGLILRIHRDITTNTLDSKEDEENFRNSDEIEVRDKRDHNITYHKPPGYGKVPEMIEDLCKFANDEEFVHPIVKAIIIHFLIGYIHPFNDGNGRTARALFYWYALKKGYELFEYLSISKIFLDSPARYTRAFLLTETDENDMTYFIDFNLKIITKSMDNLTDYIAEKQKEQKDALLMAEKNPVLSFREAQILKDMISKPDKYFSVSEVAGKYKTALQTARKDLQKLESLGYIRIRADKNRQLFILINKDR